MDLSSVETNESAATEAGGRRGPLDADRAEVSLRGIPTEDLAMALTDLHRALRVGGVLDATGFDHVRPTSHVEGLGDSDSVGLFLRDLLIGAGFVVEELSADLPGDSRRSGVIARARRARTLPDTVGPGMRLLVCGLNPSIYAADAGVGFARPGNRFWPAALAAGLATVDRDPESALRDHGVGMTDLVKRATVAASELRRDEYRTGFARVERLVRWLRPGAICFVGLAGWRAAVDRHAVPGVQPRDVAGVPVYVMPSTSGLNASSLLADLTDHLRAANRLTD